MAPEVLYRCNVRRVVRCAAPASTNAHLSGTAEGTRPIRRRRPECIAYQVFMKPRLANLEAAAIGCPSGKQ